MQIHDRIQSTDPADIARKNRRVAIVMMIWLGLLFGFVFAGPQLIVKEATVKERSFLPRWRRIR